MKSRGSSNLLFHQWYMHYGLKTSEIKNMLEDGGILLISNVFIHSFKLFS